MEHVKLQDTIKREPFPGCVVYEYPTKDSEINIGVAEISHRYPQQGYALNHKCTEMAYVVKGTGKLVTDSGSVVLSAGDVVLIPRGEKYYWEGKMTLILPTTPAWYVEQHATLALTQ